MEGLDLKDALNARYWKNPGFREAMRHTRRLGDIDPSRYSSVYFVGGHGAMWDFPSNPDISRVTKAIYEAGSVVGAVCHGPAALVDVRLTDDSYLVAGKNVSAFTDDEEREVGLERAVPFLLASTLTQRGATHHPAANWASKIVVDGRS